MKKVIDKFKSIPNHQKWLVLGISAFIGALVMPHDTAIATTATKYIFPSLVAGICFGLAIMIAIELIANVGSSKVANNGQ